MDLASHKILFEIINYYDYSQLTNQIRYLRLANKGIFNNSIIRYVVQYLELIHLVCRILYVIINLSKQRCR